MSDQVRSAIVTTLSSIPGIGQVHAYERYAQNDAGMKLFYGNADGQLRGWFVRRKTIKETRQGGAKELVSWQIRGYMSLSDATQSEILFDDLIDSIRAAFRANRTLNGTVRVIIYDEGDGLQVQDTGPVLFAGVLCHAATLVLSTERLL